MNILSNSTTGKVLKNDVLALSQEAKQAKIIDNEVVNATIGSLYDDNAVFYSFKSVDKVIKSLPNENFYTYSPTNGNASFHEAVCDWVFGKYQPFVLENMKCKSIPTPGGTGAVSNSLYNSLDEGQILLLPDIYWAPYKNMAESNCFKIMEYPFIIDGKFNIKGFISACEEIIKTQDRVVTILNDPCNNPTGYTLTLDEFQQIVDYMNSKEDIVFNLIYDIAYFDYYTLGPLESRRKFEIMTTAKKNILFNICFSCSKTFSVYGLRLGAQIILSNNAEFVKAVYASTCYLARTRWSNVCKPGISMLIEIYKHPEIKKEIQQEQVKASKVVLNRAKVFTDEAEKVDLKTYPFSGGFFITVPCKDGLMLAEELKKHKVYVLGLRKAVRIAICSIPVKEVYGLATKIKNAMKILSF